MADVIEIDAATGTITERDFTPDELAQREADEAAAAQAEAARAAEAATQAAAQESAIGKLAALGFTAEEITAVTPAEVVAEKVHAVLAAVEAAQLA